MNQRDIAKQLGVSQTLVSLVINNPATDKVSAPKRKMILDFVRKSNYNPVKTNGPTKNIGYLVDMEFNANSIDYLYQQRFLNGIIDSATDKGLNVIVQKGEEDETFLLSQKKVDGVIIKRSISEEQLTKLASRIPTVMLNVPLKNLICDSVVADNFGAMRDVVTFFHGNGIRKIALLELYPVDPVNISPNIKERIDGFSNSCWELGLDTSKYKINVRLERTEKNTREKIREVFKNWMNFKNPPEAIICLNDFYASILLSEAVSMGIRIPEKVQVASFDNSPLCSCSFPALSSVDHNNEEMGKLCVDILSRRINGDKSIISKMCCKSKFVLRETTINKQFD